MKQVKSMLHKHLTAVIFLAIYLVMAVSFLFLEGFQAESQYNLITAILPCILLGMVLDYMISRNTVLNQGQKLFARILPSGIFILYFITLIFQLADRTLPDYYNYFYYLLIAGPFMMVSYQKEGHGKRMIFSLIGTALIFAFYLNLTTKTDQLDKDFGLIIFMISYFMMFYSASAIRRLPYLPVLLGVLNTAVLWYLYRDPLSTDGLPHSWDYDYLLYFEYIMLGFFLVCMLMRFLAEIINRPAVQKADLQ